MVIHTERLTLRSWRETDAANLFAYASDPDVGPAAGWPPHRSVEESREIIRTVFSAPYTFAVCLGGTDEPIGSIGLMPSRCESSCQGAGLELEVGYWIAKPFWGRGFAPEAVRAMQHYAFETLGCKALWCGYYEGNDKSLRVQQKCGFAPHHVEHDVPCELMGDVRTEYFTYLTCDDWRKQTEGKR